MDPRRGARNDRASGQAVSVQANVIVAERGPRLGDGPLRHCGDGEILRAEFELDGTLDRRAVLRLDKEHSRPALAARGADENGGNRGGCNPQPVITNHNISPLCRSTRGRVDTTSQEKVSGIRFQAWSGYQPFLFFRRVAG